MSPSEHITLVRNFIKYVEEELFYVTFYIDENLVALLHPEEHRNFRGLVYHSDLTQRSMIFNMQTLELFSNFSSPKLPENKIGFDSEDSFEYLTLNTYLEILKEEQ